MNRTSRTWLLALAAWIGIAIGAILNGTLREALLLPLLGTTWAPLVSVALLALVILLVQVALVRGPWRSTPPRRLLLIGTAWMLGTILFELALGRLVLHMSWSRLLAQYDLLRGNLWPLIPLLLWLGMPTIQINRDRGGKGGGGHQS